MTSVYDDIQSDLVQALEGVHVLNNTDIGHLKVDGLTKAAKLIAILDRRIKRLCVSKLDEVKKVVEMHAGLMWGRHLMVQDTGEFSAGNKSF